MISTDATRLDRSAAFIHKYVTPYNAFCMTFSDITPRSIWVAPIQIAIGIGLLIGNASRFIITPPCRNANKRRSSLDGLLRSRRTWCTYLSLLCLITTELPAQVLLLGFPIQFLLVKMMFAARSKGVVITDQRVRLTTEVRGIRLINFLQSPINL